MLSRKLLRSAVVAAVAVVPTLFSAEVASASVKVGVLTCHVAPGVGLIIGSRKALSCSFSPTGGSSEYYSGRITRIGIDIGITGKGVIVWGVFAAHGGYARHALAGHYGGASAEASLIAGLGGNALVGGSHKSFALQPFSIKGQVEVNIAAGITGMTLTAQ